MHCGKRKEKKTKKKNLLLCWEKQFFSRDKNSRSIPQTDIVEEKKNKQKKTAPLMFKTHPLCSSVMSLSDYFVSIFFLFFLAFPLSCRSGYLLLFIIFEPGS